MKRAAMTPTGEATIGPFFPPRYVDEGANDLTVFEGRQAKGEAIEVHGRVVQEDGTVLENLVVEIWQPDADGIFRHPADPRHAQADPDFLGWGRAATDDKGRYAFRTIRPGAPEGRAPHINVMVMFSGLMRILKTTLYFEAERANDSDPILSSVPSGRKELLVAKKQGPNSYRFDIRLCGDGETPFFDD